MNDVTRILADIQQSNRQAADQLLPLVYDELRRLASARLAQENSCQTLQATALVHEAYLRLVKGNGIQPRWDGREHFFGAAAEAMRRILVDQARHKLAGRFWNCYAPNLRRYWASLGAAILEPTGAIPLQSAPRESPSPHQS